MLLAILFFIELFSLFLMSKTLTAALSLFIYRITRSKTFTIYFLAFLFFPGTLLHELAHAVVARLLLVPVYHMEFFPRLEGTSVKLGSVGIERTDPIRRLFIGMAPFFIGTSILLGVLYFAGQKRLFDNTFMMLAIDYFVFEIGNTMFSSKRDIEGAIELFAVLVFFAIVLYLLGFRLPSVNPNIFFVNPMVKQIFEKGDMFLLLPLGIDGILIMLLHALRK